MAVAIQVAGPCLVKTDTGSANALESLGYTRDGAQITFDGYMLDVPVDDNGGEAGPPADVQYMGETATIVLNLTKYDSAVIAKVTPRLYGGTDGQVGTPGTLFFGDSKSYRLLLATTLLPYNFVRAILRSANEVNKGTKFSEYRLVWTAYKNASSVLWNTTVV